MARVATDMTRGNSEGRVQNGLVGYELYIYIMREARSECRELAAQNSGRQKHDTENLLE